MSPITISTFSGEVPKVSPRLLGETNASVAINCDIERGMIEPMKGPLLVQELGLRALTFVKSSLIYNTETHEYDDWVTWKEDVSVCRSAIVDVVANDNNNNGENGNEPNRTNPKVYGALYISDFWDYPVQLLKGDTEDPALATKYYRLGIPRPTVPMEATCLVTIDGTEMVFSPRSLDDDSGDDDSGSTDNSGAKAATRGGGDSDEIQAAFDEWNTLDIQYRNQCQIQNPDGGGVGSMWIDSDTPECQDLKAQRDAARARWMELNGYTEEGTEENNPLNKLDVVRSSVYVYTFVRKLEDGIIEQESGISPPSNIIDIAEGGRVALVKFNVTPDYNITHIRIYRSITGGSSGTEYQFVAEYNAFELGANTILYDEKPDSEFYGELCETIYWDMIPDNIHGLIRTDNGIYCCFRGNEVLFSELFIPYAYPEKYRVLVEDNVVALGYTDNAVVILTEGNPYMAVGAEPESLQIVRIPIEQSCVSAKSVAMLPGGVMYASPDGLMLFTSNNQELVTEGLWTRDQWQALHPEKILATWHNKRYVAFFKGTARGFVFDPTAKDIVWIQLPAGYNVYGIYHDSVDDAVYVSIYSNDVKGIFKLEAGDPMEYTWKSKHFFTSALTSMNTVRVVGEQYRTLNDEGEVVDEDVVNVEIFKGDNTTMDEPCATLNLTDSKAKRLPQMRSENLWAVSIKGKSAVHEIRLGSSVLEVQNGE